MAKLSPSDAPRVDGPLVLAILDGVGIGLGDEGDAVAQANTPFLDSLKDTALGTTLQAHGTAVGMPSDSDMGNSEVGHNALGAGRIIAQGAKRVDDAIKSGELFEGKTWQHAIARVNNHQSTLHFIGLLSDGNVHSHIDHLLALIARANTEGVRCVRVHALLDGRDVPKTSAHQYLQQLESALGQHRQDGKDYAVASGGGRMVITMDRYEADWPMVKRGWDTHVLGKGRRFQSAMDALETLRDENPSIIDQEVPPFVIGQDHAIGAVQDGDSVIAFNFRGDRMVELCAAFDDEDFNGFDRERTPYVFFCGMTLYDGDTHRPKHYLVDAPLIEDTLSELLCQEHLKQFACSETQKFGHVTYFWNGNRSDPFDAKLEQYQQVPSLPPPFDGHPEMRAAEITDAMLNAMGTQTYRFLRCNYANGDMVGHTGNVPATIRAMEFVDQSLARLHKAVAQQNGALVITADHGNADDMFERDKTGTIVRNENGVPVTKTSHSLNAVPFYVLLPPQLTASYCVTTLNRSTLANVAATLALLLGYRAPPTFEPSLLQAKI